jgi:hypothetical protein
LTGERTAGRRAIVEIRWGPLASRKAVIDPGRSLRVGATDAADLVVPHDRQLSSVHFALTWDGAECTLRDEGSAKGTFLNGERIGEGRVANGDWIRAGDSIFSVYFEEATPPRRRGVRPLAIPAQAREEALSALRAEPDPVFAVLDAARDARILELLHESVEPYRSLYEGVKGEALGEVAPHLVELPRGSRLLDRLVHEGWGRRWGVYLASRGTFDEVRRHLRRFLKVRDEATNAKLYFRFYDPAVLRVILPTCDVRQTQQIFGEIACFLVEGERGEALRFAEGGPGRA